MFDENENSISQKQECKTCKNVITPRAKDVTHILVNVIIQPESIHLFVYISENEKHTTSTGKTL